jgi:hypothetical protein
LRRQAGWGGSAFATAATATPASAAAFFLAGCIGVGHACACGRRGIGKMHNLNFDRIARIVHRVFWNLTERQARLRLF